MSKVLVIKTDENWNEHKKRWFDIDPQSVNHVTDVKFVCIYNGDGTGGGGDRGGCVLKVKEWLIGEDLEKPQWAVGIGAYAGQAGHILYNWGLVKEGIIDLQSQNSKSPSRFVDELKWTEIPVGHREPDFENLAIDLKTGKQAIAKFYGVTADQVAICING